jgi:hypothetical protein
MDPSIAQSMRDAIAAVESRGSGNYAAVGPATKSGDHAYGRYQMMGNNLPQWTQAALGHQLTPAQFLADPKAQDAVFDNRFGGYLQNHSPDDAAAIWFTGKPLAQAGNAHDVLGTTAPAYVQKFNAALPGAKPTPIDFSSVGANASAAAPQEAFGADTPGLAAAGPTSQPDNLGMTLAALASGPMQSAIAPRPQMQAPTFAPPLNQNPTLADLLAGTTQKPLILQGAA